MGKRERDKKRIKRLEFENRELYYALLETKYVKDIERMSLAERIARKLGVV